MSGDFDLNDALQDDADTVRTAVQGGVSRPPLGTMVVKMVWVLGVLSLMLFIVMLPFVGESKAIPAEVWIGGGTMFMAFFFVLGVGIKLAWAFIEP